jgi:hypothetical protein
VAGLSRFRQPGSAEPGSGVWPSEIVPPFSFLPIFLKVQHF